MALARTRPDAHGSGWARPAPRLALLPPSQSVTRVSPPLSSVLLAFPCKSGVTKDCGSAPLRHERACTVARRHQRQRLAASVGHPLCWVAAPAFSRYSGESIVNGASIRLASSVHAPAQLLGHAGTRLRAGARRLPAVTVGVLARHRYTCVDVILEDS
jgi:hypothetical protein